MLPGEVDERVLTCSKLGVKCVHRRLPSICYVSGTVLWLLSTNVFDVNKDLWSLYLLCVI